MDTLYNEWVEGATNITFKSSGAKERHQNGYLKWILMGLKLERNTQQKLLLQDKQVVEQMKEIFSRIPALQQSN